MMRFTKHILKSLTTLVVVAGLLSPWVTVLLSPQYAFAQTISAPSGSALGNQITRNNASGESTSLASAAAGGAVSVGTCLAAAGITFLGGLTQIAAILGFSVATQAAAVPVAIKGKLTSVPVQDDALILVAQSIAKNTGATAVTTAGALTKSSVFDCIAWALAKMIWRAVAASIIDWINSGFNGRPAFIQDLGRFMTGIADQAIGSIIQADSTLSFLCSPFSLKVRLALAVSYSRRSAPACTLTQIMKNIKNFAGNFNRGGWPAWLELNQETNNPYGAYLVGRASIDIGIQTATGEKMSLLNWSGGFLSKTESVCSSDGKGGQVCRDIIVTPGELIAKQAGDVIGQGNTQLLLADEMNQIISALVSQLLQKALKSFSGLSGSSGYQDDYYRSSTYTGDLGAPPRSTNTNPGGGTSGANQIIAQIDQGIQTEQNFQQSNRAAINVIQNTQSSQTQAAQCWNQKITTGNLSPSNLAIAQSNAAIANTNNTTLATQSATYQANITRSTASVLRMNQLITRVRNATTQGELATILNDYYILMADGGFATQLDVTHMDATISNLQATQAPLVQQAQQSLINCSYFPAPPPVTLQNSTSVQGTTENAPPAGN